MVSDARDDETQIRLRINSVEFGRTDQAINGSSPFTACIRTGKKIVLPPQRHCSQRTFRRIVIDLDSAITRITDERNPKLQGITDGFRQR